MRCSAKLQFSLGRRGIAPARADGSGGRNGPTDARCVQDRVKMLKRLGCELDTICANGDTSE